VIRKKREEVRRKNIFLFLKTTVSDNRTKDHSRIDIAEDLA
jgi:hypothetical protein